jgi:pyruvate dehydrogenase kinase 2/3/4
VRSFRIYPSREYSFCRYYASTNRIDWPPEVQDYNKQFTKILEHIKSRHDPTVTTVAQGVLEWKRSQNARHIGHDIQAWLDRFYMSRIGIRFLIGQREVHFHCHY